MRFQNATSTEQTGGGNVIEKNAIHKNQANVCNREIRGGKRAGRGMKRRVEDGVEGEGGRGLLDGLTEAEWRLRKIRESVQQQAELHSLRIAEVQLRMEHMQEERRERVELDLA